MHIRIIFIGNNIPENNSKAPLLGLAKAIYYGQSTRRSELVMLSPFYAKCFSLSIEREDSREEFQKKKRFDEAEEIAKYKMRASNTLPSILSKLYRKTHECRVILKNRNKFV